MSQRKLKNRPIQGGFGAPQLNKVNKKRELALNIYRQLAADELITQLPEEWRGSSRLNNGTAADFRKFTNLALKLGNEKGPVGGYKGFGLQYDILNPPGSGSNPTPRRRGRAGTNTMIPITNQTRFTEEKKDPTGGRDVNIGFTPRDPPLTSASGEMPRTRPSTPELGNPGDLPPTRPPSPTPLSSLPATRPPSPASDRQALANGLARRRPQDVISIASAPNVGDDQLNGRWEFIRAANFVIPPSDLALFRINARTPGAYVPDMAQPILDVLESSDLAFAEEQAAEFILDINDAVMQSATHIGADGDVALADLIVAAANRHDMKLNDVELANVLTAAQIGRDPPKYNKIDPKDERTIRDIQRMVENTVSKRGPEFREATEALLGDLYHTADLPIVGKGPRLTGRIHKRLIGNLTMRGVKPTRREAQELRTLVDRLIVAMPLMVRAPKSVTDPPSRDRTPPATPASMLPVDPLVDEVDRHIMNNPTPIAATQPAQISKATGDLDQPVGSGDQPQPSSGDVLDESKYAVYDNDDLWDQKQSVHQEAEDKKSFEPNADLRDPANADAAWGNGYSLVTPGGDDAGVGAYAAGEIKSVMQDAIDRAGVSVEDVLVDPMQSGLDYAAALAEEVKDRVKDRLPGGIPGSDWEPPRDAQGVISEAKHIYDSGVLDDISGRGDSQGAGGTGDIGTPNIPDAFRRLGDHLGMPRLPRGGPIQAGQPLRRGGAPAVVSPGQSGNKPQPKGSMKIDQEKPPKVSTAVARNQVVLVQQAIARGRAYRDVFQVTYK